MQLSSGTLPMFDQLDVPLLISGFIFSAAGFVYFSYARKMNRPQLLICGIALMGYPYLVTSLAMSILIGAILSVTPFIFKWW